MVGLCLSLNLIANSFQRFRNYTIDEGLPSNTINSITSDSVGFVWIATGSGLVRFDGNSFRRFDAPTEGEIDVITEIQNSNNQLWYGSGSKLLAFDLNKQVWKAKASAPLSGTINFMVFGGDSTIFYASGNAICRYNLYSEKTIYREFEAELNAATLTSSKLIVSDSDSIYALNPESLRLQKSVGLKGLQKIYRTKSGGLLVANESELLALDESSLKIKKTWLTGHTINALADDENDIWVGTEQNGLIRLSKKGEGLDFYNTSSFPALNDNLITALHIDANQHLWIGTRYGGVHLQLYDNELFMHYHPGNLSLLRESNISGFLADDENNVLLITPDELYIWENGAKKVGRVNNPVENIQYKTALTVDGQWYIGSNLGLWKLDRNQQLKSIGKTGGLDINAVYKRKSGIWIIATNENEFIQADSLFNFRSRIVPGKMRSDNLPPTRINSIIESSEGQIFLGTENGLIFYNESLFNFKSYQAQQYEGLNSDIVVCVYEDLKKRLWIGTENGGLSLFNPQTETFAHFGDEDGFPAKSVYAINEDAEGVLWLGTEQGMFRFGPDSKQFTRFTTAEGIQDNRFLARSTLKLNSGELLFGGVNGFNRFDPRQFLVHEGKSNVVITSFRINNDEHRITNGEIELKHDQNDLFIDFALLDIAHSGKNSYAISLSPLNEGWIHLGNQHSVIYNDLAPGSYQLKVRGWSNEGVEGFPTTLSFTILSPWWKTPLAYGVYVLIMVFIVVLISRFFIQRVRLRNQLQIETLKRKQSEEMINFKLKFYTNVSHEIRTPLTLIAGPVQQLASQLGSDTDTGKQVKIIQQNTSRLLRLVEQLLDFRRLQSNKLPFKPVSLDIVSFVEDVLNAFRGFAESRAISIRSELPEQKIVIAFDPDKMEKILFNLLSNATKFAPDQGFVEVKLAQGENGDLVVSVSDNGPGIDDEKRDQIFDRFESEGGIGIGLALTKELVEMHQGKIYSQSISSGGSCFIVELPLLKGEHLESKVEEEVLPVVKTNIEKGEYRLLVVEDNSELREYIVDRFVNEFTVYKAENGQHAWANMEKYNPDLVISDVMMPEMDGISLCRNIKEHLETCHIPVVLLTAYSDVEHQIEGSEAGADLYIAKPFNEQLLRSKVIALLANRKRLKEKFSTSHEVTTAAELANNKLDQSLVDQLSTIIAQNLDNPELNVELLASGVGLSRSQLTRKLNGIAGMAPGQFIQNYRLKMAAHWLKTTDLNISEIAYQAGFTDPKYFARNFKKLYGCTPSDFRK